MEGEDRRDGRRVESPAHRRSRDGLAYEHSNAQEENSNTFERFRLDFDQLKLQISYRNLKFGQNRSCRGRENLQLLFWAKVDLELGLGRKHAQIPVRFK